MRGNGGGGQSPVEKGVGGVRAAGKGGRQEAGEIGINYAPLRNILQSKAQKARANKNTAGTGIKGYGRQEV